MYVFRLGILLTGVFTFTLTYSLDDQGTLLGLLADPCESKASNANGKIKCYEKYLAKLNAEYEKQCSKAWMHNKINISICSGASDKIKKGEKKIEKFKKIVEEEIKEDAIVMDLMNLNTQLNVERDKQIKQNRDVIQNVRAKQDGIDEKIKADSLPLVDETKLKAGGALHRTSKQTEENSPVTSRKKGKCIDARWLEESNLKDKSFALALGKRITLHGKSCGSSAQPSICSGHIVCKNSNTGVEYIRRVTCSFSNCKDGFAQRCNNELGYGSRNFQGQKYSNAVVMPQKSGKTEGANQ